MQHLVFRKFTVDEVDKHSLLIMGKKFNQVDDDDKEIFYEEYNRMEELPSLSLLSNEKLWDYIDFDERTCLYYYKYTSITL